MNNLEWINEQIEECKQSIQLLKIRIDEHKKYPSWVKSHKERIEELKPILKRLEQIKNILEAWEVVKPKIKFEDLGEMQNGNMYRGYFDDCFDEEEYNKTEKALEVKNDNL